MESSEFQSRLHDLFADAIDLAPSQRPGFLTRACGNDPRLRPAVEDLLAALTDAGRFLADPVIPPHAVPTATEPARIGPYVLLDIIGEGGHGTVYRAGQDPPLARTVAIKVIRAGLDSARTIARFDAERQALARMDHPGIARVYDAGSTPAGQPYFVMELVAGPPITDFSVANNLSADARVELIREVCAAVQHAHQKGLVHRDIKPSNVLVAVHDGKPVPKIIDFGIARAIGTEGASGDDPAAAPAGTPSYASPEQLAAGLDDVDTRADVYGLGMILYELLAGRPAFDPVSLGAKSTREVVQTIRETTPPPPGRSVAGGSFGTDLDQIVIKAIDRDRSRRYPTVEAFSADLLRYLRHEPVQAVPPTRPHRARLFVRRHRRLVATTAALTAVILAGITTAVVGFVSVRTQRDRAVAAEHRADDSRLQAEAARLTADTNRRLAEDARQTADQNRVIAENARHAADASAARSFSARQFLYQMILSGPDGNVPDPILDYFAGRESDPALTEHPQVLSTLHLALAGAYLRSHRDDKAIDQYRKFLVDPPDESEPDRFDIASAQHNLGLAMINTGDDAGARPVLEKSLASFRKLTGGNDDYRDAPTLEHLALTLANTGDPAAAEPMLRHAIEMYKQLDRDGRHHEWSAMSALAQVLDLKGDHAAAAAIRKEVRRIRPEPPKSPTTAD